MVLVDVVTGAPVADDDAISTIVPPSPIKREGAYVGVLVAFEGACVGGQGWRGRLPLSPPPRFPDVAKLPLSPQSCCRQRHHRRRAVASLSPPQTSCSQCLPAAAAKLLPPLPPPCRTSAAALPVGVYRVMVCLWTDHIWPDHILMVANHI